MDGWYDICWIINTSDNGVNTMNRAMFSIALLSFKSCGMSSKASPMQVNLSSYSMSGDGLNNVESNVRNIRPTHFVNQEKKSLHQTTLNHIWTGPSCLRYCVLCWYLININDTSWMAQISFEQKNVAVLVVIDCNWSQWIGRRYFRWISNAHFLTVCAL